MCSTRGARPDDGHAICTLGRMSAVRRKGNKVPGAHHKGLVKVCLLAVGGPKECAGAWRAQSESGAKII